MTSQSAERIGGWLLAPLAWLLVALLSASLSLLFFANALMSPQTYTLLRAMSAGHMALWVASLLFALGVELSDVRAKRCCNHVQYIVAQLVVHATDCKGFHVFK